jgi:hypothetical protein
MGVQISHPLASLQELHREVCATRSAAAALAALDRDFDYSGATSATAAIMGKPFECLKEEALPPAQGPRLALRRREDYLSCLPEEFTSYEKSPTKALRGDWAFVVPY